VPALGTPKGFLSETNVILEYLEDSGEGTPLMPADPYSRATVRGLMQEIELYIELPRGPASRSILRVVRARCDQGKAREDLRAGFATLKRHGTFAPYVAGDAFTLADIVFLYSVDLGAAVARQLFDLDALGGLPAAGRCCRSLVRDRTCRRLRPGVTPPGPDSLPRCAPAPGWRLNLEERVMTEIVPRWNGAGSVTGSESRNRVLRP